MIYKIKDRDDLIKNGDNKAVLSVDSKSLDKYREERAKLLKLQDVVNNHDILKRKVDNIEAMLAKILEKLQ